LGTSWGFMGCSANSLGELAAANLGWPVYVLSSLGLSWASWAPLESSWASLQTLWGNWALPTWAGQFMFGALLGLLGTSWDFMGCSADSLRELAAANLCWPVHFLKSWGLSWASWAPLGASRAARQTLLGHWPAGIEISQVQGIKISQRGPRKQ